MGIQNRNLTVDAKLRHFLTPTAVAVDLDATGASYVPSLYNATRKITIVEAYFELTVATVDVTGSPKALIGIAGDTDKYGSYTFVDSDAIGFKQLTLTTNAKEIAAATRIICSHEDVGTSVGEGYFHIWYYLGDYQPNRLE